ncbi:MAG: SWIM zinc finger family protein [Actinobacteria bacterium]|nr:SWIM zinc finger family protein [Actinomycetota bacterium]
MARWNDRSSSRGFPPPSTPRRVEGGIVASSTRGDIGTSWWSKRFLAVLESFALGSRLTRGKRYARQGQVISLDVLPGVVSARVQGSRRTPYKVVIGLAPFTDATWEVVDGALGGQALFVAQLLAGQVPPELEELLAGVGVPLFPRAARELRMTCSCPDWEVPCKHLAATFYLLAERFDSDPFTMLHWRGRSREALLARLRTLRDEHPGPGPASGTGDGTAPPPVTGTALALADLLDPAEPGPELTAARYWHPPVPLPPPVPQLAVPADLLLRQLPDAPLALGGADLTGQLRALYLALPGEEAEPAPPPTARSRTQAGAPSGGTRAR